MSEFNLAARNDFDLPGGKFQDLRDRSRTEMAAQLDRAARGGFHSAVVSAEGLAGLEHNPPVGQSEIVQLCDWLSHWIDSFFVIPVLRRQDLRAVSRYKNLVKNKGQTERNCLVEHPTFDINAMLKNWEDVFGRDAICPILFPDSTSTTRDLIADFCAAAGIKGAYDQDEAAKYQRNPTLDGRAIDLLRQLNMHIPTKPGPTKPVPNPWGLKLLMQHLLDMYPKAILKVQPARAQAKAFYDSYRDGNAQVCRRYFPDQDRLFHEDFSFYPEQAIYPAPAADELTDLLAAIVLDPRLRKPPHRHPNSTPDSP